MPRLPQNLATLTAAAIDKAKPRDGFYELADDVVPGFRVRIHPTGRKVFIVRYSDAGKTTLCTLGPASGAGLKDARERARKLKEGIAEGRLPNAIADDETPADGSLAAMIDLYRQKEVGGFADGTAAYWNADLDRLAAAFPGRPVRSLKKSEIVMALDRQAKRGPSAAVTAWKVWRAFFNFAQGRLDDYASPMLGVKCPADETSRDRVLDDAELKTVWLAADKAGGSAGALVKLLMLSGCRRNEMLALERTEIKADAIELSAERTKNDQAHSVPLTDMIRTVLKDCPKSGRFVINGKGVAPGNHSKLKAKIVADIPAWTFHDLRRSFASGLQKLGVAPHVIDRCINHRSGVVKGVTAIYQRHEYTAEVRAAVELWSRHIKGLVFDLRVAA
jgi:integrase